MFLDSNRRRALFVAYVFLLLATLRIQKQMEQARVARLRRRQSRMLIASFVCAIVSTGLTCPVTPRSQWTLLRSPHWINGVRDGTLYTPLEFYKQFRMTRDGFLMLYRILSMVCSHGYRLTGRTTHHQTRHQLSGCHSARDSYHGIALTCNAWDELPECFR